LDACGGPNGIGFDNDLLEFLVTEDVPATLCLNKRWIDANRGLVVRWAEGALFDLANHGTEHRPLSVEARSAYGRTGTADPAGVFDEVLLNPPPITAPPGQAPADCRSGAAH